jgi:hypothetical protein
VGDGVDDAVRAEEVSGDDFGDDVDGGLAAEVWTFTETFREFTADTDTLMRVLVAQIGLFHSCLDGLFEVEVVEVVKTGENMIGSDGVGEMTGEVWCVVRLVEMGRGFEGGIDGDEDGEVFGVVGQEFFDLLVVFDQVKEFGGDGTLLNEVVEGEVEVVGVSWGCSRWSWGPMRTLPGVAMVWGMVRTFSRTLVRRSVVGSSVWWSTSIIWPFWSSIIRSFWSSIIGSAWSSVIPVGRTVVEWWVFETGWRWEVKL